MISDHNTHQRPLKGILFIKILSCLVLFVNLVAPINSYAEESLSLKQMLLSPGKLSQAHADIESKCESCHTEFDKSNQTPLCLDCHEKIQEEVTAKEGFHGRLDSKEIADCKTCHTDHKGRDFNITNIDVDNFDHSQTDFNLENSHQHLSCSTCHDSNRTESELLSAGLHSLPTDEAFRFKEFECSSCHLDYHEDSLGSECESCHSTESWKKTQFDHKDTDFILDGKHMDVRCQSCHVEENSGVLSNKGSSNQFKKIETTCASCHQAEEPHLGLFGSECKDCHTTESWKNERYDHLKETGFALKGSHHKFKGKPLNCIDCHSKLLNPDTECSSCHKNDDVHQGSNGDDCSSCHNEKKWSESSFDHNDSSVGFQLDGAHKEATCDGCHQPGKDKKKSSILKNDVRECSDCHQETDPHGDSVSNECSDCHNTISWVDTVRFSHDFSDFPLSGSHQLLVCESCHLTSNFSNEKAGCVNCHKEEDIHETALGDQCETCHDSSTWSHWNFDHDSQTKFFLEGSHRDLKCSLCHDSSLPKSLLPDPLKPGKECISCHRDDDIHRGALGNDCKQCHTQKTFSDTLF